MTSNISVSTYFFICFELVFCCCQFWPILNSYLQEQSVPVIPTLYLPNDYMYHQNDEKITSRAFSTVSPAVTQSALHLSPWQLQAVKNWKEDFAQKLENEDDNMTKITALLKMIKMVLNLLSNFMRRAFVQLLIWNACA